MGVRGKDFVMVCTDLSAVHSIITIKQDEDKIVPIDSHKVFCIAGEAGDRVQFSEYIIANVKLYALRNSTELSTKSVAHYARGELAVALRKVRVWYPFHNPFHMHSWGTRGEGHGITEQHSGWRDRDACANYRTNWMHMHPCVCSLPLHGCTLEGCRLAPRPPC